MPLYSKENCGEISFPLGGIGTGCIGLGGNGRLRDWEIFNRPAKNTANGFSHIMVRAEKNDRVTDVRVLQGDWPSQAAGGETRNIFRGNGGYGLGFGPYRGAMAGVPHFSDHVFKGEFPFASIRYSDPLFPGRAELCAFNPFIPLNDRDSSLPAAFFEITLDNTTSETYGYTVFFTLNNPLPFGAAINQLIQKDTCSLINMSSSALKPDDPVYGNLCISTDERDISWQEYWYRAKWFDSLETYWHDVNTGGRLENRRYEEAGDLKGPLSKKETILDGEDHGTLAVHCSLNPGEQKKIRFVLAWYFPNFRNYWNPERVENKSGTWKNYYASLFRNSAECAEYALQNWDRLYGDTCMFRDALFETSLPDYCLDAVSANLSILKSPTCLRLENGEFYGFEGCSQDSGCCEGSCSHVWNYAYALPFLFPKLERSMRDLDYAYNQSEDGAMSFRLQLPLGSPRDSFRPCVDGQMGGVIKVWRDYLLSGDIEWLRDKWEPVKKSIEFAWAQSNADRWDYDRDGVMEGRQHHTLDMELFGPSGWLNGFYLAALRAGANIASLLGHSPEAEEYEALFQKGRAWCNENLFNGEYFIQKIDITDKDLLVRYDSGKPLVGSNTVDAYWNSEYNEIKYQIAGSCLIDQVVAQWHANLCGLGDIFDREKTKSALEAIFRYNFKTSFRNVFNAGRVYCLDDDAGAIICVSPPNRKKPHIPITYAEDVLCGMEYQAAVHMIQEGMIDKGFALVKAIRDRFDGRRRNPWNEFECGGNYARSMASFSLIPSIGGFSYNLGEGYIGFNPLISGDPAPDRSFKVFFSTDSGWGSFLLNNGSLELKLLYGTLTLKKFGLPDGIRSLCRASINNRNIEALVHDGLLVPSVPIVMEKGSCLKVFFQ
jgi:uncharacterized protein (DUF608 family)